MRFALLEIKMSLVQILRKYNVRPGIKTPEALSFIEGFSVRRPKGGVSVLFEERKKTVSI